MRHHARRVAAFAAVAIVSSACGLGVSSTEPPEQLVLLSALDEHGEDRTIIDFYVDPNGEIDTTTIGSALATVLETDGPWLRVTTLEGAIVTGWVDDFGVHGRVHLSTNLSPTCPVQLASAFGGAAPLMEVVANTQAVPLEVATAADGRMWVRVSTLEADAEPSLSGWVPRAWLNPTPIRRDHGYDCTGWGPIDGHFDHGHLGS